MKKGKIFAFIILFFVTSVNAEQIKICTTEKFIIIDPHLAHTFPETQTMHGLVYESIVKYNPRTKALVPFLIERWTSYSENKNYKLIFGKDILFTTNRGTSYTKLEALDFVFSINLYLEKVRDGKIIDEYAKNIKNIELSEDQKEVVISLVKADSFFMHRLAGKMGLVLSQKYYEDLKKKNKLVDFYKNPVSTGAFRIKKLHSDEMELEVKKHYHFGKLGISGIKFVKTPDEFSNKKYIQNGLCDISPYTKNGNAKKLTEYINSKELYIYLTVNPRSRLASLTKEMPLWELINFNSFAQSMNPHIKDIGQFVSDESSLKDYAQIDMIYSLGKAKEQVKRSRLNKLTIYFKKDVQENIANIKSFLSYLKKTFSELGIEITMGDAKTADMVLDLKHLNGVNELTLEDYYEFWPDKGELNREWFQSLSKKLGKNVHVYPIGFMDTTHVVNNKLQGFFSHHSQNFDLTILRVE